MKIIDELIEQIGESELTESRDGSHKLVVDVEIVEKLEEIRAAVEHLESLVDSSTEI